jgi:hypothetical protein
LTDQSRDQELERLLASINPQLEEGIFTFCLLEPGEVPAGLDVQMLFREREATTVVVPEAEARQRGLTGEFPCQWITLGAQSDLAAVGFLAAVTTRLAAAGISTNAVSAYFHDHIFVPAGQGERAVAVLEEWQGLHQFGPSPVDV